MDIDFKWFAIMMGVLFSAMFFASAVESFSKDRLSIEAAKAGLEQCPMDPDGINSLTVWVKDCNAYIKEMRSKK